RSEGAYGYQQAGRPSRAGKPGGASDEGRALSRTGLPDRRHLEDAARLLDEQGADPDEGQEATDLRHRCSRDGDADQAGEGQGPQPRRGDRGRAALPRGAERDSRRPELEVDRRHQGAAARSSCAAASGGTELIHQPAPSSTPARTERRGTSSRCQSLESWSHALSGVAPTAPWTRRIASPSSCTATGSSSSVKTPSCGSAGAITVS